MKRSMKDSGELIGLITKALSEQYGKDPSKPGLLIAHLPNGRTQLNPGEDAAREIYAAALSPFDFMRPKRARDLLVDDIPAAAPCFYVAAQRFLAPRGGMRTNVAKAYADDLDEALLAVAREVCPSTTAQQDLEAFLRRF